MSDGWSGNRVCALFGSEHPIVQAGMVYNSGARLAAAAANAGCLGLIGAGSMRPDLFREQIHKARTLTDRPFGVNLPLIYPHIQECLEIALAEGIRIIFTSAGSPRRITPLLKKEDRVSVHVVAHPDLARKCEEAGCDAVVCEGFEAGGHNGREEITTMVLVPECVAAVNIPSREVGGDIAAVKNHFAIPGEISLTGFGLDQVLGHGGADRTRAKRKGDNTVLFAIGSHTLRQAQESSFGNRVGAAVGNGDETCAARHVDDSPMLAGDHRFEYRRATQKSAGQVHVERVPPFFRVHFPDRARHAWHARVVYEKVDRAEFVLYGSNHGL